MTVFSLLESLASTELSGYLLVIGGGLDRDYIQDKSNSRLSRIKY